MRGGEKCGGRSEKEDTVEKDFVKLSPLGSVDIGLDSEVGVAGGYNGGAGRVATAAFRMGRRSPLRGEGGRGAVREPGR